MTATDPPATTSGAGMSPLRKHSLTAGILYLITFISIPTLGLYGPVRVQVSSSALPLPLARSGAVSSR